MTASLSPFGLFQRLDRRERRVVAAGATVSILLLTTIWLVLPFAQHWTTRDGRLMATRQRWARLTTLVGNTDHLRETLDIAKQATIADENRLLEGDTPALAASALQELVQRDAALSTVQVERVDVAGEPHTDKPGLLAIPVQLQARGDLFGLVDFLGRLQQDNPLLVVDELTINAGSDAADGDDGPVTSLAANAPRQVLTWTLHLHGLYEGTRDGNQ